MKPIKERPILFSGPMVSAILERRKTQTRRIVKPQPSWVDGKRDLYVKGAEYTAHSPVYNYEYEEWVFVGETVKCPYGKPGDQLWVRESTEADHDTCDSVVLSKYSVDKEPVLYSLCDDDEYNGSVAHWWYNKERCPSIHMPRWVSRIDLEILSVRVERLQDISEDDCDAEGFGGNSPPVAFPEFAHLKGWDGSGSIPQCFASLWESINGKGSWDANPWVWVLEFRRIK